MAYNATVLFEFANINFIPTKHCLKLFEKIDFSSILVENIVNANLAMTRRCLFADLVVS